MARDQISTTTFGDIALLSRVTQPVIQFALVNSTSASTTFAWTADNGASGLTPGDQILVTPPASGLSTGILPYAFCATAGTATLVLLNGSTSTVTQAAATWTFRRMK